MIFLELLIKVESTVQTLLFKMQILLINTLIKSNDIPNALTKREFITQLNYARIHGTSLATSGSIPGAYLTLRPFLLICIRTMYICIYILCAFNILYTCVYVLFSLFVQGRNRNDVKGHFVLLLILSDKQ